MSHYKPAHGACPEHLTVVLRKKPEHFNTGGKFGTHKVKKWGPKFSTIDECEARGIDYNNFKLYMMDIGVTCSKTNGLTIEEIFSGYEKLMGDKNLTTISRYSHSSGKSHDVVKIAIQLGFVKEAMRLHNIVLIDPIQADDGMINYREYRLEMMAMESKMRNERHTANRKRGFKKGAFRFATDPSSIE
jgi:hypothetical protein